MAWNIELTEKARKNLERLDPMQTRRILAFLYQRIAPLADPRSIGQALQGATLGAYWKYRVGDYRIIAFIDDQRITITATRISHRSEAYR